MTRQQRLFIRRVKPNITGALIILAFLIIMGIAGKMDYDTLKIIYGQ